VTLPPATTDPDLKTLPDSTLTVSHVQVPVAIGGKGLPEGVHFAEPGPEDAGLTNVTATFMNLLGFEAPPHMRPTLLATPGENGMKTNGKT